MAEHAALDTGLIDDEAEALGGAQERKDALAELDDEEMRPPDEERVSTEDPLQNYLQEIGSRALLTAQQQVQLGRAFEEGKEAGERLAVERVPAKERAVLEEEALRG